jgi:hypothetical protein
MKHQKLDDDILPPGLVDSSDDETDTALENKHRRALAQMTRRALIDHFRLAAKPDSCDIVNPSGSVAGLPPGADEAGNWQLNDQDAQGQMASQPKPQQEVCSLSKGHPGPKIKSDDIEARDQRWVDIGSGVVSRVFKQAHRLFTTSQGGPCMADIQSRRVWSLSSGKLIDECNVDDVPDKVLHRALSKTDDIRVELVLKDALAMYERVGPDVSEIFSQPRICQEAAGRKFAGETLTPGWSLDLTTLDPATGER